MVVKMVLLCWEEEARWICGKRGPVQGPGLSFSDHAWTPKENWLWGNWTWINRGKWSWMRKGWGWPPGEAFWFWGLKGIGGWGLDEFRARLVLYSWNAVGASVRVHVSMSSALEKGCGDSAVCHASRSLLHRGRWWRNTLPPPWHLGVLGSSGMIQVGSPLYPAAA